MVLKQILITNVRNIKQLKLELHPRLNFIQGPNGCGKTSILEAIYFLSHGRSFRTHKVAPIISYQQQNLCLNALLDTRDGEVFSCGISRYRDGRVNVKVAQESVCSIAEVAKLIPTLFINAETFNILSAGPQYRRQFLDWGVFHVEHTFLGLWKRLYKILKQRNAALRHNADDLLVKSWDDEYIAVTHQIDALRRAYLASFVDVIQQLIPNLPALEHLEIIYRPGWEVKKCFADALAASFSRDRQTGFTHVGPHRADLNFRVPGGSAGDILSRGQQKMLIYGLRLSQGAVLQHRTGKASLYLLDDLPAELDIEKQSVVMSLLTEMNAQVCITGVDLAHLSKTVSPETSYALFQPQDIIVDGCDEDLLPIIQQTK